jgi:hypothetical protein
MCGVLRLQRLLDLDQDVGALPDFGGGPDDLGARGLELVVGMPEPRPAPDCTSTW